MKILLMVGLLSMMLPCALHAAERTLTEKNSGEKVMLRKGDLLTIELPSNPTTGYSWSYVSSKRCLLGIVATVYRSAEKPKAVVGSGGVDTWKFKALEVGSLKLTFNYARPWEKGEPPARTLHWPVTIRP